MNAALLPFVCGFLISNALLRATVPAFAAETRLSIPALKNQLVGAR